MYIIDPIEQEQQTSYTTDLSNSINIAFGNWSFPAYSRDTLSTSPRSYPPQVPLAKSIRGTERHTRFDLRYNQHQSKETKSSAPQIDQSHLQLPSLPSVTCASSSAPISHQKHVPRPPNAFMLFRSDFLKRGIIPLHVERRQQNLSRIAGQCWNLLSPEEKGKWQEQAAKVLIEHQKRNPDYKFTPAPRGSRRIKNKIRSDTKAGSLDDENRIKQIREEYAQVAGPTVAPTRRRTRVQNRPSHKAKEQESSCQAVQAPIFSPLSLSLSSPGHSINDSPSLPPFFPQCPIPHAVIPRRPSTSLGFSSPSLRSKNISEFNLSRPVSAASSETGLCAYLRDLDIAPKATAPPAQPVVAEHPSDALRDALPFSSLNQFVTPLSTSSMSLQQHAGDSYGNDSDSLLSALYSEQPLPFVETQLQNDGHIGYEDNYFSGTFNSSILDGWDLCSSPVDSLNYYNF